MLAIRARKYDLIFVLVLTIVNPCLLRAQSETSSAISGTVTDASGAVVADASITATEANTKAVRAGRTDAIGHYLFSQVNPGTYQITVSASGFAVAVSEPTLVDVGRNVALNFSLHPQSSNQTVEVSAQQGLLSLDNPNTTTTIEPKDDQKPSQPRAGSYLSRTVRAGRVDEYRRFLKRCEGGRRLRQR